MIDNLNALNSLSSEEREMALTILKQMEGGNTELYEKLLYADYKEIPVDIETFLKDRRYLGAGLTDDEGRFTVYPYWVDMLKKLFPTNLDTKYNTLILTGSIGIGKAQPLDSLVLTEHGFKKMGELTLDDKVYGNDGKLHRLLGIFPQGKKQICRVEFTDGTSTLCCDEHLWRVYNIQTKRWATVETKELVNGSRSLRNGKGHKYKIPITSPVEFEHKDVYIDPYTMGVLIGDGCLLHKGTTFTTADTEIVDNVSRTIADGYKISKRKGEYTYSISKIKNTTKYDAALNTQVPTPNNYTKALSDYGLNVKSTYKHIPQDYLCNDVKSRIALLQGLMDTDGYITKDGSVIEYCTTSEQLKDDFVFLVQSLGGVCHIRIKHPRYFNKKYGEYREGTIAYNIGIKLPKSIKPFRLTRKLERLSDKAFEPFRYIKDIVYLDRQECQCIYVDSEEHLYLTNDFIVTHNTLVAVVAMLYMLYRMLCLIDPYKHYGLQPIDTITFSFMNITKDAAKGVAWSKCQELLKASPWFLEHGTVNKADIPEWKPSKGIELIYGSQNRHVIGRAVFCSFADEANFQQNQDVEKQKKKELDLIKSVDARMISRFMKGDKLPTLHIIASSKSSEQSFLETYIETKKKNNSTTTLIIDEPQWVIRTDKDSGKYFYVAVGNKFLESEVIPDNADEGMLQAYRDRGYSILPVPTGYRESFLDHLDIALTDIAGISTTNAMNFISGVRWAKLRQEQLHNPFTKEIIVVGNAADDTTQYWDFFDLSEVPSNLKSKPLFIHLDMSISGDKTGIAGVWIVGKKPHEEGKPDSSELFYQIAFSVAIQAPKGRQISFEKNRQFIYWLQREGFNIAGISSDTFQSADMAQSMQAKGFDYKIISVDRVQDRQCKPYQVFKSAIYEERIAVYPTKHLTEEIIGLVRDSNGKIDHTSNGINCFTGDTKVQLTDGRSLSFLDLKKEFESGKINYVYSINETTLEVEEKPIVNAFCSGHNANLVKVVLDNFEELRCTPEHRFMLQSGEYCEAQNLTGGTYLMSVRGCSHRVVDVECITETEDVYDITVKDNHNFALAAGVFVHNSKDTADAVCGAIYNASTNAEQYAYDYGESLETVFNVNDSGTDIEDINGAFEDMLKKMFDKNGNFTGGGSTADNTQMPMARQQTIRQPSYDELAFSCLSDGIII